MLATSPSAGVAERIRRFVSDYETAQPTSAFETRRGYPRHPMAEPVDLMLDSSQTPADVVLTTGRDISLGGIGVYANRPIRPGTEMVVGIDNGEEKLLAKAVAVHSTLSVGLFKIGARFIL